VDVSRVLRRPQPSTHEINSLVDGGSGIAGRRAFMIPYGLCTWAVKYVRDHGFGVRRDSPGGAWLGGEAARG
jgi:hypothetical protein